MTEDDWDKMAVHHTAGPQTSGGSVAKLLQALQAMEQDSGAYCDLPYQFMVGFDGSLYEGRPLTLYSAATGGNNAGNLAVCFVGCYHPAAECPDNVGHEVTAEMMASARLLIQTVSRIHDIPTTSSKVMGHRDYPGNSTACPGNFVYPRLDELRADLTWYAAVETARSIAADAPLEVPVGSPTELWVELRNTGGLTWMPGTTMLAPTPRDVESPLADDSWISPTRAATVEAPVAPGEVGRFRFEVRAAAIGDVQQQFGLVEDGVTWFGDTPWGGGPGDDAITLRVHATENGGGGGGSGCATGGTGNRTAGLLVIGVVLLVRRRRSNAET